MTYAVFWKLTATRLLQQLIDAADDPDRVRAAASRMEFMLRRDPRSMGESRSGGFRVWYEDVLGMYFRVDDAAMQVEVFLVGPARRH